MSHTYARNYLHLIFGTKLRCRILKTDAREVAHNEIRRAAIEYGVSIDTMGGTEDHIHLLFHLPPKLAAAVLVRAMKAKSSKAMNDRGYRLPGRKATDVSA
jgi:putative transposase